MLMRDPSYLNGRKEMAPLISNQQSEMAPLDSETQKVEMVISCSEAHSEDTPLMETQQHKQQNCASLCDKFGLHLLKNWMFVMFMISYATSLLCHMSLHWFIPHRAVEIGFTTGEAAVTLTVVNLANIFSRVLLGFVISDKFLNQITILTCYVFVSGITTILAIFWTNYWSFMIFAASFGLLRGLLLMYVLLITQNLVGKSQVDLALGLIFSLAGLVFLVFIPIFGHLNEVTHSYTATFILYGSIELFGRLFLVTIPVYLFAKKMASS